MVTRVSAAERWRLQVVHELSKKVNEIQNGNLGEHMIRDINDRINRLINDKFRWERRIVELGGPNYTRAQGEEDGMTLPGSGRYKYFGAAKELPGVRELFQAEKLRLAPKAAKKKPNVKHLNPDYYGYRDEMLYPQLNNPI